MKATEDIREDGGGGHPQQKHIRISHKENHLKSVISMSAKAENTCSVKVFDFYAALKKDVEKHLLSRNLKCRREIQNHS